MALLIEACKDSNWSCPQCTYINTHSTQNCAICNVLNIKHRKPTAHDTETLIPCDYPQCTQLIPFKEYAAHRAYHTEIKLIQCEYPSCNLKLRDSEYTDHLLLHRYSKQREEHTELIECDYPNCRQKVAFSAYKVHQESHEEAEQNTNIKCDYPACNQMVLFSEYDAHIQSHKQQLTSNSDHVERVLNNSNILPIDEKGEIITDLVRDCGSKYRSHQIVKITIDLDCDENNKNFDAIPESELEIHALYIDDEKISNIMNKLVEYLNAKYPLYTFYVRYIRDGFAGFVDEGKDLKTFYNSSITEYRQGDFTAWHKYSERGLRIVIDFHREHKIKQTQGITCEYMNKSNSKNAMQCPIYTLLREKQYNHQTLKHIQKYKHFIDELSTKDECKYGDECKSYINLEKGGNDVKDRCHLVLYRHPPRTKHIKLSKNMHSLVFETNSNEIVETFKYSPISDGAPWPNLIEEVIRNGFQIDLCLYPAYTHDDEDDPDKPSECKHDVAYNIKNEKEKTIVSVIDELQKHPQHIALGSPLQKHPSEMLALILYTGCDCNYDLCRSQRNGDYSKWKWFDRCLWDAIHKLSQNETGSFQVFSGLSNVKMDKRTASVGYFVTYTSTSWDKDVAKSFMTENNGMLIQIDEQFKNNQSVNCCDVSWLSKFPHERQVLFARSVEKLTAWNLTVIDQADDIQTVLLKQADKDKVKKEIQKRESASRARERARNAWYM